jgi:outer membrane protein assembly factor BamB
MLIGGLLSVSVGAVDYLTEGVDNGRTGWLKAESVFTVSNVKDTKLLWKVNLLTAPRQMHNLFAPLVVERVTTAQGVREIALVAGISDDLIALDAATGQTIWRRRFDSTFVEQPGGRGGGTLCPGGQTAVPVVAPAATGAYTVYAVSWDGRLRQLNLADGQDRVPPEKFVPPNGKPYALNLFNGTIYTSTAQGCGGVPNGFYAFDLATRRTSVFLPAGGGLWGRRGVAIAPDGTLYMGTGDAPFNPTTKSLGTAVVAVKADANKQLQIVDYYAPPNANWLYRRDLDVNVTPVVFDYRGRRFLVATSKECRLWLLDRDALGGDDHRTALGVTPLLCNDAQQYDGMGVWGALAAWQDATGRQWVVVPFYGPVSRQFKAPIEHSRPAGGGVAAYTLEERAGKWELAPQWLSRDMDLAEHAIVANGIVFTYASGEDASQTLLDRPWDAPAGGRMGGGLDSSAARRIPNSRRATIYALDALTGKELWNSGDEIRFWNHYSGLTVANGRAYLATFDGTMYAFGVPR